MSHQYIKKNILKFKLFYLDIKKKKKKKKSNDCLRLKYIYLKKMDNNNNNEQVVETVTVKEIGMLNKKLL